MAGDFLHESTTPAESDSTRERELNLVEDQFIAELFRLTRSADADTITGGGLGPRELPEELEVARAIWT